MGSAPFHLGWFYSKDFGPKAWKHRWAGSAVSRCTKPEMAVDLAVAMERAGVDYLMIEDSSNVPYTYQGSHNAYLRHCVDAPRLDPMVVAPFMLARAMNALDHDSDGLICWNVVTGSNDGGAQNYGRDKQYPPNERYDTADEVVEVANGLWNSWEEDALVLDLEKGIFADGSKVHPINHDGPYFRSRGPLSSPRPPQGSPGICQAGGSGQGKAFASRWAETVIAVANGFFSRRYVTGICDGLVPELHKRGGTRTQYEFTTFRENLMAF